VKSQLFYWLIIVLVFLNTVFVAVEFHRQPQFLTDFLCESLGLVVCRLFITNQTAASQQQLTENVVYM